MGGDWDKEGRGAYREPVVSYHGTEPTGKSSDPWEQRW